MATFTEERFRPCLLKIARAEFSAWDLRRDGQHRHAGAVRIIKPVNKVQVPRSTGPGTDCQPARNMRSPGGGKSRDFLMPDVHPADGFMLEQLSVMPFRLSPTTP